jgi:hypothetical protein
LIWKKYSYYGEVLFEVDISDKIQQISFIDAEHDKLWVVDSQNYCLICFNSRFGLQLFTTRFEVTIPKLSCFLPTCELGTCSFVYSVKNSDHKALSIVRFDISEGPDSDNRRKLLPSTDLDMFFNGNVKNIHKRKYGSSNRSSSLSTDNRGYNFLQKVICIYFEFTH